MTGRRPAGLVRVRAEGARRSGEVQAEVDTGKNSGSPELHRENTRKTKTSRVSRAAHVITTDRLYAREPSAGSGDGDQRSGIPSRAAPGSAPQAAPHWSIRMGEGRVTHRREGWASRGAGSLGAAHA